VTERTRYQVVFAEAARDDLVEIARYLARRESPALAAAVLEKLRRRAMTLRQAPLRGRYLPELAPLGIKTWRELVASPFGLVYRVTGRSVAVVAVLDRRRDLRDLLHERLIRRR
jgi:toxin ParE1/3/4